MKSLLLSAHAIPALSPKDETTSPPFPTVEVTVDLPILDQSVIPELEEFLAQLIASNLLAETDEQGGSHDEKCQG